MSSNGEVFRVRKALWLSVPAGVLFSLPLALPLQQKLLLNLGLSGVVAIQREWVILGSLLLAVLTLVSSGAAFIYCERASGPPTWSRFGLQIFNVIALLLIMAPVVGCIVLSIL